MNSLRGLTDGAPSRDEIQRQMAALPPVDPSLVAFGVANADLVREDYAEAFSQIFDATSVGKRRKLARIGIGVVVGLVVGVVAAKVVL